MIPELRKKMDKYIKATGNTETDIASMLGVRETTVYQWARTNGLKMHRREEKALRKILGVK